LGAHEFNVNLLDLLAKYPTNKKIAGLWSNDTIGLTRQKQIIALVKEVPGFTLIDGGAFDPGTEDYTSMIGKFKKEGCEFLEGIAGAGDFSNFWKQCHQQSWVPKIADVSKPTLFPTAIESFGAIGYGLLGPQWWHPLFPWTSSLTGETCAELALNFEQTTGLEWLQPLMHYVTFEWAVDIYKRVTNLDDKEEVAAAMAATNMKNSVAGPLDFTAPLTADGPHKVKNVVSTPLYYGQWVKGTTQRPWSVKVWPFDLKVRASPEAPMLQGEGPVDLLTS
jgi:branched-chain amino acid transport system substrate-binding protein